MFEIGTKIRVVASSARKQTSPRRGSIGYVANICNEVFYERRNMATALVEVVFYRYGFEQKTRVEKRNIICVFPVADPGKGDIRPQVVSVMDLVNGRQDGNSWSEDIRVFYSAQANVPVTIAVPVMANECSLLECSDDEFTAAMSSYIISTECQMFIHRALMEKHHQTANDPRLGDAHELVRIRDMSIDPTYRSIKLRTMWLKDRVSAVNIIRMINSMRSVNKSKEVLSDVTGELSGRLSEISVNDVYRAAINYLMVKPAIDRLKTMAEAYESTSVLAILETIEVTRGVLLVLSSRMEKAYTQAHHH